jgi:hypothetical protein
LDFAAFFSPFPSPLDDTGGLEGVSSANFRLLLGFCCTSTSEVEGAFALVVLSATGGLIIGFSEFSWNFHYLVTQHVAYRDIVSVALLIT